MAKSRDAFRTISEVSDWLETPAHVLRFWESRFSQVKPLKRAGGRRYYRPNDMLLLGGIKRLLHDDGITIKGVQKVLREKGVKYVAGLCLEPLNGEPAAASGANGRETTPVDAILKTPEDSGGDRAGPQPSVFQPAEPRPSPLREETRPVFTAPRPVGDGGKSPREPMRGSGEGAPPRPAGQDRMRILYHRLESLRDRIAAEID